MQKANRCWLAGRLKECAKHVKLSNGVQTIEFCTTSNAHVGGGVWDFSVYACSYAVHNQMRSDRHVFVRAVKLQTLPTQKLSWHIESLEIDLNQLCLLFLSSSSSVYAFDRYFSSSISSSWLSYLVKPYFLSFEQPKLYLFLSFFLACWVCLLACAQTHARVPLTNVKI